MKSIFNPYCAYYIYLIPMNSHEHHHEQHSHLSPHPKPIHDHFKFNSFQKDISFSFTNNVQHERRVVSDDNISACENERKHHFGILNMISHQSFGSPFDLPARRIDFNVSISVAFKLIAPLAAPCHNIAYSPDT